ncbi:OmpA family protein [Rhodococcus marinonascens]|uniref:OmpA family protein n=1 Tax=Rhodococcus marinonascens TaxID=38311 RepID=UPI00093355B2|nr:OmpA family protein [Rhodococcus marinonascens]
MVRKTIVSGAAVAAIALAGVAGCSNENSDDAPVTTTTSSEPGPFDGAATSIRATASSAVNTALEATQNAINSAISAVPVQFESDSSELDPISNVTLTTIALALKTSDADIKIDAYADKSDEAAAQQLAEERADSVASALEAQGIDKNRISTEGTANPGSDVNVDQADITVGEN